MGFAVKQASGGPKEAMDEIQEIICAKACQSATKIIGTITELEEQYRDAYLDAWKKGDGLECFEDLFQIAGNLIESSNAADFRRARRNNIAGDQQNKEMVDAAVGSLSANETKRLERKLDSYLPVKANGEANPNELNKVSDEMTKVGYLEPGTTGHCLQRNSECPEGAGKERSKPAKVSDMKEVFRGKTDSQLQTVDDFLNSGLEGADLKVKDKAGLLQVSDLMQEDDLPIGRCESGRKKPTRIYPEDSDYKEAQQEEQRQKNLDLFDRPKPKKTRADSV